MRVRNLETPNNTHASYASTPCRPFSFFNFSWTQFYPGSVIGTELISGIFYKKPVDQTWNRGFVIIRHRFVYQVYQENQPNTWWIFLHFVHCKGSRWFNHFGPTDPQRVRLQGFAKLWQAIICTYSVQPILWKPRQKRSCVVMGLSQKLKPHHTMAYEYAVGKTNFTNFWAVPKINEFSNLQGMKTKSLRYPGISNYIPSWEQAPRFTFRSHLRPMVSHFVSARVSSLLPWAPWGAGHKSWCQALLLPSALPENLLGSHHFKF